MGAFSECFGLSAGDWLRKRLIPRLQDYPVSTPRWFATGMQALLCEELPEKADRDKFLEGGGETAAFLAWVIEDYGREAVVSVSQDCRRGFYDEKIWKHFTQKTFEELVKEYQEAG